MFLLHVAFLKLLNNNYTVENIGNCNCTNHVLKTAYLELLGSGSGYFLIYNLFTYFFA